MATFHASLRGSAHSNGPSSSHNSKLGLPVGMDLCEIVRSGRKHGKGSFGPIASANIQPIKHVDSLISTERSKSQRGSHFERKGHLTAERVSTTEEEAISENNFLSTREDKKLFVRFSDFLRDLTRQEKWAGFLDPFQIGGGNESDVNYFIQELNLRNETLFSSPDMEPSTLELSSQTSKSPKSVSTLGEQSDLGTTVSFYPDSDSLYLSANPMNSTTVGSPVDFSYATETLSAGIGSYASGMTTGLSSAPALTSSAKFKDLVFPVESTSAEATNTVKRKVLQPDLSLDSPKCVTAQDIGSVDNLARWLEHRIGKSMVSRWGVAPGTKEVANLWCELVEGEIFLLDCSPPMRFTNVISVKIKNEEGHVLVESYQEMADGRRRLRNRPLSEKVRPGEPVEEACLRGISEELGSQLGASDRVVMFPESYRREEEERESFSYPGLPTRYIIHTMVAHIQQLPSTEFSTEEDESGHGGSPAGVAALNGSDSQKKAIGVKRHFWRWVPEHSLAELCRR